MSYPPPNVRCFNLHSYPPAKAFKKGVSTNGYYYRWIWERKEGDLEFELELAQTSQGIVRRSVIWKGNKHVRLEFNHYLDKWPDNHEEMCDIVDDPEYHFRILML